MAQAKTIWNNDVSCFFRLFCKALSSESRDYMKLMDESYDFKKTLKECINLDGWESAKLHIFAITGKSTFSIYDNDITPELKDDRSIERLLKEGLTSRLLIPHTIVESSTISYKSVNSEDYIHTDFVNVYRISPKYRNRISDMIREKQSEDDQLKQIDNLILGKISELDKQGIDLTKTNFWSYISKNEKIEKMLQ